MTLGGTTNTSTCNACSEFDGEYTVTYQGVIDCGNRFPLNLHYWRGESFSNNACYNYVPGYSQNKVINVFLGADKNTCSFEIKLMSANSDPCSAIVNTGNRTGVQWSTVSGETWDCRTGRNMGVIGNWTDCAWPDSLQRTTATLEAP